MAQPKETAVSIRYPSVALLCVDSADGESYNSAGYRVDTNQPNRIYINNQKPLTFGYMTRIALTEFNIQWNTPNVNARNNTLTISLKLTSSGAIQNFTITILEDFYSPSELASRIQTQLNSNTGIQAFLGGAPGTQYFTVSINSDLNVVIEQLPAVDFTFKIIPTPNATDDLTNMLGLTPRATDVYVPIIVGGYASYQYTPYIDITSNFLTKNQNVQDGDTAKTSTGQKLARIYLSNEEIVNRFERLMPTYASNGTVNGSYYSTNVIGCKSFVFKREFKTPKVIQWNNTENVDVIDIEVLDYKGNPLYINPGSVAFKNNTADIQFTIQVTEV